MSSNQSAVQTVNKRVMTSAIPNMSVAEVRKALGSIRHRAKFQTPAKPFYITDSLRGVEDMSSGTGGNAQNEQQPTMSIEKFAFDFCHGQWGKRQRKSAKNARRVTS